MHTHLHLDKGMMSCTDRFLAWACVTAFYAAWHGRQPDGSTFVPGLSTLLHRPY